MPASIHVMRYLAAKTRSVVESSHRVQASDDRRGREPVAVVLLTSPIARSQRGAPETLGRRGLREVGVGRGDYEPSVDERSLTRREASHFNATGVHYQMGSVRGPAL